MRARSTRRRRAPTSRSPRALGGVWHRDAGGVLDPVALAYGLRRAVLGTGRSHPRALAGRRRLRGEAARVVLECPGGRVRARRAVLGTSAYPPLLRSRAAAACCPSTTTCSTTEPLSAAQHAAIGWASRQGVTDGGNQFHYFRLTADNRILYGGYDAIYHWRNRVGPQLDQRHETFSLLAEHLLETFPQLEGIRFSTAGAARSTPAAASSRSTALRSRAA